MCSWQILFDIFHRQLTFELEHRQSQNLTSKIEFRQDLTQYYKLTEKQMPLLYSAVQLFTWYSCNLFFRDITLVNQDNIPKEGPVIIYGNHNNQFVDGMLLVNAVPRPISFIAAAKSVKRPIIGQLINASGAIPVERPQDIKQQKGPGTITGLKDHILTGNNTKFTRYSLGTTIHLQNRSVLTLKRIISDNEAEVEGDDFELLNANETYKYFLKLDFHDLYESVWTSLKNGKCVGIFPEGGSHDRLALLPLKAGICIMALGAMQKYGVPVKLVPCGFNYYNPHKFRSKAVLQFGPAYEIPIEMIDLYRHDKKRAISILLTNIQQMLKAVTIEFDSYDELFALFQARQLYALNCKRQINIGEKLQLNRRFAKGYMMIRSNPRYGEEYSKLLKFAQFVQMTGVPVTKQDYFGSRLVDFIKFIIYLEKCLLRSIVALPGVIMMGPTTSLIVYLAQRERIKCLKGSKVKQYGNDVVGSYKILLSTFLLPLTCAGHSFLLYFVLKKFTKLSKPTMVKLALGLFALQPIYALLFVKSYDSFRRSWLKLKYMFLRIFKPRIYEQFNQKKKQIQGKIMDVVEEIGEKVVENFDENRILKKEQLHRSDKQLYIFDEEEQVKE